MRTCKECEHHTNFNNWTNCKKKCSYKYEQRRQDATFQVKELKKELEMLQKENAELIEKSDADSLRVVTLATENIRLERELKGLVNGKHKIDCNCAGSGCMSRLDCSHKKYQEIQEKYDKTQYELSGVVKTLETVTKFCSHYSDNETCKYILSLINGWQYE